MNLKELLKTVQTVLVIDWPSKEVPETLASAGLHVVVRGGPGPEDFSVYELKNGEIRVRRAGRPPERADLIYAYRPFRELPEIVSAAKDLHAKTIWTQSGLSSAGVQDPKGCWVPEGKLKAARKLVQSAGLNYVAAPYIADVIREIRPSRAASRREPAA